MTPTSVLRDRNFAWYFLGEAVSVIGDAVLPIALSFAVFQTTGSMTAVGVVFAAGLLPEAVLLFAGGVLGDRFDRRQLMIVCDLVRMIAQALGGVLLLTGQSSVAALIAVQVVCGTGMAFFRPAVTGLVRQVVPPAKTAEANALVSLSDNVAHTVGPALGAAAIVLVGPGLLLVLDAVISGISAAALAAIRVPTIPAAPEDQQTSFMDDLVRGWQEFRSRGWLVGSVLWLAGYHLLAAPALLVLGPAVATARLGGVLAWSTIVICSSLGAVAGSLLALRLKTRFALRTSLLPLSLLGLPLVLLATSDDTVLIAASTVPGSLGYALFTVYLTSGLQQHVPPEVLSRLSVYQWSSAIVLAPIGLAVIEPLSTVAGQDVVLVAIAVIMALATLMLLALKAVRSLELYSQAHSEDPRRTQPLIRAGEPT